MRGTIGDRIRKLRLENSLTMDDLAKRVGYSSRASISRVEHGETDLPLSKVDEFAEALNSTPAYLMGWSDDPYDKATTAEDFAKEMIDTTPTLMDACDMAIKARDILIGLFWERSKDNGQG